MTLNEKKKLYKKASDAYYNTGKPIMSDAEFDKLERQIQKEDPEWLQLKKTGTKVADKKTEVELAEFMPSLNKIYPEAADKWIARRKIKKYRWSHKLDGNALQGVYQNNKWISLVTRGDGTMGGDISFLIPHLNLPKLRTTGTRVTVRFEAIMKKKVFAKKWSKEALGPEKGFDNARNLVSGALNSKKPHKCLSDVDFVVLGVYNMGYVEGLEWASDQGLQVVVNGNFAVPDYPSIALQTLLRKERATAEYEMDGLVLAPPDQAFTYEDADKPKWAVAFKVNEDEDAQETVVEEVIWQISRTNRIVPKIRVKPIKMKGVEVTYATAHNAEWMTERGIGKGAVVKLVRSGDVIPKIIGVTKKAKVTAVPDIKYVKEGVHFVATERHKESEVREIHHFFQTLGIEFIARKTIEKLYDVGFTTVLDHLNAYGIRMKGYVEAGVGEAMTGKIYTECSRTFHREGVTLIKLMNASNCFESFGERKLQLIQDHFAKKGDADVLRVYVQMKVAQIENPKELERIQEIKGMGKASAKQFFEGLMRFKMWFAPIAKLKLIKVNNPEPKKAKKAAAKGLPLSGQYVSWTGYRSEDEEKEVEAKGGEVIKFGAKTTVLLYKEGGKASSKIQAARDKGIRVCTIKELLK